MLPSNLLHCHLLRVLVAVCMAAMFSACFEKQPTIVKYPDRSVCVAGSACTVELDACLESQKAAGWKGQTSLSGTLQLASYTSHYNWVCATPVQQGWPVPAEPGWWCGRVADQCACSATDGCR